MPRSKTGKASSHSASDLLPRWTERLDMELGGRDPLGLSRVAHWITGNLVSGITTQTHRARYYSFYCWCLWHIEKVAEESGQSMDFGHAFRRREAAMALATILEDPEASPIGKNAINRKLAETEGDEIDTEFRVLPANATGGFGQYYGGSLFDLGLAERDEAGSLCRVGSNAVELAEAFHEWVKSTPYVTKGCFNRKRCAIGDISNSAPRLSLGSIDQPGARHERELLIDVFWGRGDDNRPHTALRRRTLAWLMHLIDEYRIRDLPVHLDDVDEQLLYGPAYFDVLVDQSRDGWPTLPVRIPGALDFTQDWWRQFALHNYLTVALELLAQSCLESADQDIRGRERDEIIADLTDSPFHAWMSSTVGRACPSPRSLLANLGWTGPVQPGSAVFRRKINYEHACSESSLFAGLPAKAPPAERAARAMLLLAVLHLKWRWTEGDDAFDTMRRGTGGSLWTGSLFPFSDTWERPDLTWTEAVGALVDELILNQHDRVMYRKGRLDSRWFDRNGTRIRREQALQPERRASRFENAVEILRDVNLLAVDDDERVTVTPAGRQLTRRFLESADAAPRIHQLA